MRNPKLQMEIAKQLLRSKSDGGSIVCFNCGAKTFLIDKKSEAGKCSNCNTQASFKEWRKQYVVQKLEIARRIELENREIEMFEKMWNESKIN